MSASYPLLASVPRLLRLIRKELSESLRDRRTILTLVLMPVLLYPLLVIAFQQMVMSAKTAQQAPKYRVALPSQNDADLMGKYWDIGRASLIKRHNRTDQPMPLIQPMPELIIFTATDLDHVVRTGNVDVGVRLLQVRENDVSRLRIVDCEILVREGSAVGKEVAQHLEQLTTEANVALLASSGTRFRLRDPIISISAVQAPNETQKRSDLIPVLVPLILILMTMTGAVYPAIDLTAGERERGTLEVLVAAPIPRLAVLFAKYIAVLTVALLTALVNLGMMAVTLSATGLGQQLFADSFTFVVLAQVLGLLVLFAAFFSAVLLILTSFARSFKEAQAYLIPLMLFCLLPGMLALLPDLKLEGPLLVVPLMNIVLLARDLFAGRATMGVMAVVVVSTLVYAVAAIATAARIFGTEAVLSSEQSGWGDFFRKPEESRPRPAPASALLCLALMFPVYFLLVSGISRQEGLSLAERFGFAAAGNVMLFAALPLLFLWRGRIGFASGLRLKMPPLLAWLIAVLLGVSLWPWANEAALVLRQLGLTSLREDMLERAAEAMKQWREVSPLYLLLVLAILPALMEELFFRGFLFSALLGEEGNRRVTAVVATAALFAVFHIFVPGGLAVERLLISFVLGLVLGWLALASGSVWPGVVLHVLHNGILVLGGYYKDPLIESGWLPREGHLAAWLLATSAAAVVAAAVGLVWLTRRR